MVGTVVAFDRARGLGEIESDGRRLRFHATRLLDGSRSVAVGAVVRFEVVPGLPGAWEAVSVAVSPES